MTALLPAPWDSDNSVPLTVDEAVSAIQNSRRRHVIVILDDVECPHSVSDLAEAIAAIGLDKDISELDAQHRKTVYIALVQHHLDILDEVGAISYEERSKELSATEATAGLVDLVRHVESVCEERSYRHLHHSGQDFLLHTVWYRINTDISIKTRIQFVTTDER